MTRRHSKHDSYEHLQREEITSFTATIAKKQR